jgi:hypothetical protein
MSSSNSRLDYWLIGPLRRFAVNTVVVWTMLGLYMFIDHHQPITPSIVLMPAWVPFWPIFCMPYVGLLLITWLLPAVIRDAGLFRACIRANVCAWLLVMPWWILIPTTIARPPLPHGVCAYVFYWLWTIDQPYNVFPCAHGIGPVVAAWFVGRDHWTWRWPLIGIVVLGLSSIALIWQHRPIDILLGTMAAVIGIAIGEALSRREQASLKGYEFAA